MKLDINIVKEKVWQTLDNNLRLISFKNDVDMVGITDDMLDWISDWFIEIYEANETEDGIRVPDEQETIRGVFNYIEELQSRH